MNLEIRLRDEATDDLAVASSWYECQLPRLGHEFLDAALELLESIPEQPLQYPVIYKDVRCALLPRFPFGIL